MTAPGIRAIYSYLLKSQAQVMSCDTEDNITTIIIKADVSTIKYELGPNHDDWWVVVSKEKLPVYTINADKGETLRSLNRPTTRYL